MSEPNVKTIFLIEDDPLYANIVVNALSSDKRKFIHFESGEKMLEGLEMNPDLCILDFHLEGSSENQMNGLEIMQALRSKSKQIPIIMLSGLNDVQLAVDILKYNASDYVVKNENSILRLEESIEKIFSLRDLKQKQNFFSQKFRKHRKHVLLTFSLILFTIAIIQLFS